MPNLWKLLIDFFKDLTLSKFLKGIVLVTLLTVFGYFGKDVLSKFADHDTSFTHSVEKNDASDNPRMAFCFNPSIKSTAAKRYNLLPSAFESFMYTATMNWSAAISWSVPVHSQIRPHQMQSATMY